MVDRTAHTRPMLAADYTAVRAVWGAAGLSIRPHGRDTEQAILSQLSHFPDTYLVAECDGQIAGTVLGTHDHRKGWINRLAVHPDYQRRGVARRLLAACEQALHAQGLEIIAALVEGDNAASAAFFRASGYELYGPVHYFRRRSRPDI
ncbi:MAG: GNAT family N-acetyltransferase [Planctomycetota bacterium]